MWQSRYPSEAASLEVLARLYPEDQTSKLVVSVVREGVTVQETLLDAAHPALLADSNASSPISVALRYVREGLLHIFGGPDHIAFVLGLLLFGGTLRQLLKTITAFTLAHSITLGIAATGIWNPSPRIVETLIALSITCIALENLRPHRTEQDLRAFLAFGFGLIHGFGFAGALSEVGLPQDTFWAALASFNIGVEMGQAAIVLAVAPLIARLTYLRPKSHRWIVILGSLAVGLAGLYWLLTRLLMPS
ncbi:MAG: HupE/UreJ family protein, partial [Armatimonadota bacterium]